MEKDKFDEILLKSWIDSKSQFDKNILAVSSGSSVVLIFSMLLKKAAVSIISVLLFHTALSLFIIAIMLIMLSVKLDADLISDIIGAGAENKESTELKLNRITVFYTSFFSIGVTVFWFYIVSLF